MSRILGWEGEYPQTSGNFYKAVVKENLLPGAETWVMPPRVGSNLGGFHHRLALCLANIHPRRDIMGRWV